MKPKTNSDTTTKLYVGLDVHKEQTSVAIADPGPQGEVRSHGSIVTCQPSIEKLLRRLAKAKGIMALRGFKIIASMMVVSEIGDFIRFTHPKQLMSYLGLTPGEYSSGGKQKQGAITKCGNSHLRWLMVECATHYRLEPKVSVNLSKRQQGQPRWIKDISWKAQNRLNARYKTLQKRLMHYNKIKVSIARELTGVIWEIGFKMQSTPAQPA